MSDKRLEQFRLVFRVSQKTKTYQHDEVATIQRMVYDFYKNTNTRIAKPHYTYAGDGENFVVFRVSMRNSRGKAGKTFLMDERFEGFKEIVAAELPRYGLREISKSYDPLAVARRLDQMRKKRFVGN